MLDQLKHNFAGSNKIIDEEMLRKAADSTISNLPGTASSTVVKDMVNSGLVEVFKLSQATAENGWKSVRLYLDEIGVMKGLPENTRAQCMAEFCGYKSIKIAGDVFIGRIQSSPPGSKEPAKHVDFHLSELSSSSDWIKTAEKQNFAVAEQRGAVQMHPLESHDVVQKADGYTWSENEESVNISLDLSSIYSSSGEEKTEKAILGKKDIVVKIKTGIIIVVDKRNPNTASNQWQVQLFLPITPDESTWTLNGTTLELELTKRDEGTIWQQLLLDD